MKYGRGSGGMGFRLVVLHLLKYFDEESEGLLILNSILIFKDLQCLINKNNLLLFEKQKTQTNI
jgi:hypothetical protein